jgi:hypothetical protein
VVEKSSLAKESIEENKPKGGFKNRECQKEIDQIRLTCQPVRSCCKPQNKGNKKNRENLKDGEEISKLWQFLDLPSSLPTTIEIG